MTAAPLTMSDPRWADARTVELIAGGSDWPEHLPAVWRTVVDPQAHALAHSVRPIPGCPGCEQTRVCEWCTKPVSECPDPSGHYRRARGSEESLLTGVATGGA